MASRAVATTTKTKKAQREAEKREAVSFEELTADVAELLEELVEEESLELATTNGALRLVLPLAQFIIANDDPDVEGWLVNRAEVSELYVDGDALRERIRPILTRLSRASEGPKWNDDLAAAIEAAPDDPNPRLVFGDWLQQEGDPRGELISVQSHIAQHKDNDGTSSSKKKDAPKITSLKKREATLLGRFRSHLLGDFAFGDDVAEYTWWYGFFDDVRLEGSYLRSLTTCLAARFMRSLTVTAELAAGSTQLLKGNAALAKTLKRIQIGQSERFSYYRSHFTVGDAFRNLRHLNELHIFAQRISLGHLDFPKLRILDLRCESLTCEEGMTAVLLPSLEHLWIEANTVAEESANETSAQQLTSIFDSPPPKLIHLGLNQMMGANTWLKRVLASPMLPKLHVLDMAGCRFDHESIDIFLREADRLRHLESLNLTGLMAVQGAEASRKDLESLCKKVILEPRVRR